EHDDPEPARDFNLFSHERLQLERVNALQVADDGLDLEPPGVALDDEVLAAVLAPLRAAFRRTTEACIGGGGNHQRIGQSRECDSNQWTHIDKATSSARAAPSPRGLSCSLHPCADVQDIPVLDDVLLAFQPHPAALARLRLR